MEVEQPGEGRCRSGSHCQLHGLQQEMSKDAPNEDIMGTGTYRQLPLDCACPGGGVYAACHFPC